MVTKLFRKGLHRGQMEPAETSFVFLTILCFLLFSSFSCLISHLQALTCISLALVLTLSFPLQTPRIWDSVNQVTTDFAASAKRGLSLIGLLSLVMRGQINGTSNLSRGSRRIKITIAVKSWHTLANIFCSVKVWSTLWLPCLGRAHPQLTHYQSAVTVTHWMVFCDVLKKS